MAKNISTIHTIMNITYLWKYSSVTVIAKKNFLRQSFSDNQTNSSPIGSSSATNPEHQKSSGNTNWSLNGAKWTRSIPERAITSSNQPRCWNRSLAIPTTLKNVNPAENGTAKKTTGILHSPTGESIAQLRKQFKFSINVNDSAVNDDFIRIIRC